VSPWASKATDIARNCGVGGVGSAGVPLHRVERVTEYRLTLKAGFGGLLFLGHSESLFEAGQLLVSEGRTAYRRAAIGQAA
jgi:hypothetical protein